MSNSTGNSRIARNTIFLYIRMAFVMIVTLYTSRVILRELGVTDFGIYNVVAGFVSMFSFLNTSLTASIQRFYNYENGVKGSEGFHQVFTTSFYIQLFLAIVIIILLETFGLYYLNNELVIPEDRLPAARYVFHMSSLSLFFVILQVPYSAAVIAKEYMDYYALVGIIDVMLKLLIVILLPFISSDNLIVYSFALLLISVIDFILYYIYSKKKIKEVKLDSTFNPSIFKSMLSFSGWSILGSSAQVVRNQGLNIIINLFFGPTVNAARGISYQVKTALASFMANIPTAARPQLTESYARGDIERSKQIMFTISKICFYLIYIIALPVIFDLDYLLHLWLGETVPEYTLIFSRIIIVITIVETFNWPTSMMIYATGKIARYNIITSFLGVLVLPISYIILKVSPNPIIVYCASLLISVIVQIASIKCLQLSASISQREYYKKVILPSVLVVLFTFFIPYIITSFIDPSFLRTVLNVIVSVILSSIIIYLVGLNQSERQMVRSIFLKLFSRFKK